MAADEFRIPGWDVPAKRTVKGGEHKTLAELADHMSAADDDREAEEAVREVTGLLSPFVARERAGRHGWVEREMPSGEFRGALTVAETIGGLTDREPGAAFVQADLGSPVELGPVVWSVEPPLLVAGGRQLGDHIRSLDIRNDAGGLRAIVEIVWPADLPLPEDVELGGCRWTVQAVGGDDGPITFLHLKRIDPEPIVSVRKAPRWVAEMMKECVARAVESGCEPFRAPEPARLRLTFEPGVRVEAAPGAAVGIEEHDEVEGWCPAFTDGPLVVERVARGPDGRTVLELVEAADGDNDAG